MQRPQSLRISRHHEAPILQQILPIHHRVFGRRWLSKWHSASSSTASHLAPAKQRTNEGSSRAPHYIGHQRQPGTDHDLESTLRLRTKAQPQGLTRTCWSQPHERPRRMLLRKSPSSRSLGFFREDPTALLARSGFRPRADRASSCRKVCQAQPLEPSRPSASALLFFQLPASRFSWDCLALLRTPPRVICKAAIGNHGWTAFQVRDRRLGPNPSVRDIMAPVAVAAFLLPGSHRKADPVFSPPVISVAAIETVCIHCARRSIY